MASSFDAFLTELGRRHRVLLIGFLAVIAHGLSRPTKDAAVWLDPLDCAGTWANSLLGVMKDFPSARLYRLLNREELAAEELADVVAVDRMIRVRGRSTDMTFSVWGISSRSSHSTKFGTRVFGGQKQCV